MNALIVAAGKGTRINGEDTPKPKPLFTCHGKYLIEHVIERLKIAGITHIYIVVGFMKEHLMSAIGNGEKYQLTITYIENEEYEKANGLSVYKAKHHLKEPFILAMSDHIFEQVAVNKFVTAMKQQSTNSSSSSTSTPTPKNTLYTDLKLDTISDIDDATKVQQQNDKIISIHKKLTEFNAVDTGMFYLTPEFFTALEKAQQNGDYSITGGVQTLANKGQMHTYDIGPHRWMDIDTKKELQILEEQFSLFDTYHLT